MDQCDHNLNRSIQYLDKRDTYQLGSLYHEHNVPISLIGVKIVENNKHLNKPYNALDLDDFIYNSDNKEDVDVAIYGEEGYINIVKDFKSL